MRRAFTLIELIVVTAIIGLLIGLLTPALAGAMASARRAKCMSNLRGFGPAISMYMDSDGSGILPVAPGYLPNYDNVIGYTRFYIAIEDYLDVPLPPRNPDGGFTGGFGPYLCPRDAGFGREHGFSYSYFAGVHMAPVWDPDAVDPEAGRRITFWFEQTPTYRMLMTDADHWHPESPSTIRKQNILYADGSVDWFRRDPQFIPKPGLGGGAVSQAMRE